MLVGALLALFYGALPVRAAGPITNAADVLALSTSRAAQGIQVSITGVVTVAEPSWSGRFFMQDASGGVFVNNVGKAQPQVGDQVHVTGVSFAGGYAPCVTKPSWIRLGAAPLPEAKPVTIDRLMSGAEDSQRIAVSGIVRYAGASSNRLALDIVSGGFRLRAFCPLLPAFDPISLTGAEVLLKGTAGTSYNAPLRHFVTVTLYVPRLEDFIVQKPGAARPFDEPVLSLNNIAQFREDASPAKLAHVKGFVVYQRDGQDLFLQDASGGLQIKSRQTLALKPGDAVEAVGFPAIENFLPVLDDAIFRKTGEASVPVQPTNVAISNLQKGLHHGSLVAIEGKLIERSERALGKAGDKANALTTLVLQNTNLIFVAEKYAPDDGSLASIPIGSVVRVTGVCFLENNENGKFKTFRVLLPSSHDVAVLARPGWLTPPHLLISLTVVLGILLMAVSWSVMVSKRNSMLKLLVRDRELAQRELQEAHGQLEERVNERTAQLKVEMTARKESELQFRAVLTERTRLAQELHDTLEQTMTGIALQLNLAENHFEKNPLNAFHHLKLARSLMRQSRGYLRDSVMGLRQRASEEFNLAAALKTTSQQIADGTNIRLEVQTSGDRHALTEVVEENLLRIGQEAVTNVVKHADATRLNVELQFARGNVVLLVRDDGKGFDAAHPAGPRDGHFGLLGMSERAARLGGQLVVTSAPGAGTSVRAEIPTEHPTGA